MSPTLESQFLAKFEQGFLDNESVSLPLSSIDACSDYHKKDITINEAMTINTSTTKEETETVTVKEEAQKMTIENSNMDNSPKLS